MPGPSITTRDKKVRLVQFAVGGLLLASAALKLDDLIYGQASALLWLPSPRWVLAAVEAEAIVGFWLLSGFLARWSWGASLVLFLTFLGASFTLALQGQSTCGCFGRVSSQVSPWMVVVLDLVVIVILACFRPEAGRAVWPWVRHLACSAIAFVTLTALTTLVLWWLGYSPGGLLAQLRGDTLLVEPSIADVGSGVHGDVRRISVNIVNQGEESIRIVGGSSNCSCVATEDLPVTVGPGESRSISVRVRITGSVGQFQQRYAFLYELNDELRPVIARFTGKVIEKEATLAVGTAERK